MKRPANTPAKGVTMAPLARGTSLETYIRQLDPTAGNKSPAQLKREAIAKTGFNMGATG